MAFCGDSDLPNEESFSPAQASHLLHLRWVQPGSYGGLSQPDKPGDHQSDSAIKGFDSACNDFCSRNSPLLWRGDGGVYLDLRGMDRLHGPWVQGAAEICHRAKFEFPVWSAGLASSPLASRLASLVAGQRGRQQLWAVPHGMVSSFLAGFPLRIRVLVTSVSFTRPLSSEPGERALRRALALRAMAWKPARTGVKPTSGRWMLTVRWSSGSQATVMASDPSRDTLAGWLAILASIWQKLPSHRPGISGVDLHFESHHGSSFRQMNLFDDSFGAEPLARTIARIRRRTDPGFASASEALLQSWGACWAEQLT